MGKTVSDAILDGTLDNIAASTVLVVCEGEPTTWSHISKNKGVDDGKRLATVVVAAGDFTKANGDTNGRKVTVGAQNGLTVNVSGDADHVALGTTVGTTLNYVTTAPTQTLGGGGTVDVAAYDIEIADPS